MYTTCLYCHRDLGTNQSVEPFPVGRKLAFDGARGRLWAVCGRCGRWNLAPIEERWEAIESCERLFRDTRIRVSTDNIGLARLREGTELVRIGEPLRPEFAAWRYTNHITQRRKRALVTSAAATSAIAATAFGVSAGLGAGGGAWTLYQVLSGLRNRVRDRRIVARIPVGSDAVAVRFGALQKLRWRPPDADRPFAIELLGTTLEGADAIQFAGVALANLNRRAGSASEIASAVDWIEVVGNPFSPEASELTRHLQLDRERRQRVPLEAHLLYRNPIAFSDLPASLRLGLEMAAHEEQERLFLSAHLSVLERAWKEAEEIAGIADDLLLPDWVRARLAR